MEDKFFTLNEVTKYLKIPRSTIYKLSQKGEIPSCKIGKQLRFRKFSIDNWVNAKEGKAVVDFKGVNRGRKSILLIEDDEIVLKSVAKFLKSNNYDVELTRSGEEALEKVQNKRFDLAVADVRMPGIDGIETIKRIREVNQRLNHPAIPEVIITGFMDTEAQKQAQDLGITDYIYKPFATTEFIEIIARKVGQAAGPK